MAIRISWPKYSANNAYIAPRNSRWKILRPEIRKWMQENADNIPLLAFRKYVDPEVKDIILQAYYFAPDRRKRDTDNLQKLYKDVLQKAWGVNDSRFLVQEQSYQVDSGDPRIEIEVAKGQIRETTDSDF